MNIRIPVVFALLVPFLAAGACDPVGRISAPAGSAPVVRALEPEFGSVDGGETVAVLGDGFSENPHVTFGNLPCEILGRSSSELVVKIPGGVEGPCDVTVRNADGSEARMPAGFTYQDPLLAPALESVAPAYAFCEGGTVVLLRGGNFQEGVTVSIQGVAASGVVLTDATTLTAVVPGGLPEGALDVVVVNPDGRRAALLDSQWAQDLAADEKEALRLVNAEREKAALAPLAPSPVLTRAARLHTDDMIVRAYLDHVNPEGLGPWDRAGALAYPSLYVGENLAAGYRDPAEMVGAWMNSPAHRTNILNPSFKEFGIAKGEGGPLGVYWTLMFGSP